MLATIGAIILSLTMTMVNMITQTVVNSIENIEETIECYISYDPNTRAISHPERADQSEIA